MSYVAGGHLLAEEQRLSFIPLRAELALAHFSSADMRTCLTHVSYVSLMLLMSLMSHSCLICLSMATSRPEIASVSGR